ncbi:hypothetical protein JYT73_02930, partial [Pseudoalteromonas haloplanktis]|nr:hypothetical protein [Pseudoalteromonas haloplanktis]
MSFTSIKPAKSPPLPSLNQVTQCNEACAFCCFIKYSLKANCVSLSQQSNGCNYRISVKKEGLVSNY